MCQMKSERVNEYKRTSAEGHLSVPTIDQGRNGVWKNQTCQAHSEKNNAENSGFCHSASNIEWVVTKVFEGQSGRERNSVM